LLLSARTDKRTNPRISREGKVTKPHRKTAKKKQTERLSLHPFTPEDALKKMLGGSTGQTVPEATVPGAKPKRSKK
jgi:hypothetical protein